MGWCALGRKERKERGEEEEKSFRYEEEDPDMFMCVSGVCVVGEGSQ